MNTKNLLNWIEAREAIRIRKEAGGPPPWTDDPILQEWSFCNVRRQDDRVTRWINDNWLVPHIFPWLQKSTGSLWFAMAVARFLNWPDSLAALGYPDPWDRERFLRVLRARRGAGEQIFGPAYIISTAGQKMDKLDYVADVLDRLWQARKTLQPREGERLAAYHARLEQRFGLGSFMAGQIIADIKGVDPLVGADDRMTFAASGPGSRRGLNRVLGRPVDASWTEDAWRAAFRPVLDAVTAELKQITFPGRNRYPIMLCGQDVQSCLCEWDKYERVRLGEGKPKRRYQYRDLTRHDVEEQLPLLI